jgi:cobalt-zinc-cadmium efflux system outer membrane protein
MPLKRFIGPLGTLLLVCVASTAQDIGTSVNAKDLVKTALERNQEYLSARERLNEAQALVRQANLRPSATIEVETATGAILGSRGESEYSAGYFHPIEMGGKRDKRVAVAQKGLALAEAEVKEHERQLRFAIQERFILAVLEELKLAALKASQPVAQEGYALTQRRVALGDAAPLEEQLLAAELKRVEVQQALFESARDAALIELRAIVDDEGRDSLRLVTDLGFANRMLNLAALQEAALKQRSDLAILKLLEEQANSEADLARAEARPDITASVRYSRSRSAFDQSGISDTGAITPLRDVDNILTFGVSIPLSNRKRLEASVDAADSRTTQQRLRTQYLLKAIPREVEAAYRRWSGAVRSMEILLTGVIEPSRKNLTVIQEAYRLGQLRLLDVLNEQRRLSELQLSYVEAQAQAAQAFNELERAVGGDLQ